MHAGARVRDFWPMVSGGLLGYDMARSQSIMRVASTASPVSGGDVRNQMRELARKSRIEWAATSIAQAFPIFKSNTKMTCLHPIHRMIVSKAFRRHSVGSTTRSASTASSQTYA